TRGVSRIRLSRGGAGEEDRYGGRGRRVRRVVLVATRRGALLVERLPLALHPLPALHPSLPAPLLAVWVLVPALSLPALPALLLRLLPAVLLSTGMHPMAALLGITT